MRFPERTEPRASARKRAWLVAILLLAAGLRAWRLDFGLPALNDPDEPIFILTALDMLREARLDPGWFGHPATLLFYLLAVVIVGVAAIGGAIGSWADGHGFVAAVFADPAVVVLPMRAAMAALGVASVYLTYRLGRSVAGPATGLVAALLLAVNPLHVELSQLIRTDMLATVLMTWSLLHALSLARGGARRDDVWAGVAAGLACATKWPAILVLIAPVSAGLSRRTIPVAPLVALVALVIASPYLVIDWRIVLRDLGGEARPIHLGATGHGVWGNLWWYVTVPFAGSITWPGVVLGGVGAVSIRRDAAVTVLPFAAVFLIALSAQSLVWERWFVPLLPLVALLMAVGVARIAARSRAAAIVLVAALTLWSGYTTIRHQNDRADDPRQRATAWLLAHATPGRTILVESAAFDLLPYRGRLLFPLGSDGCVDVRALLAGHPSHKATNEKRAGRSIVDLGHIDGPGLAGCRADYTVTTNYARYRAAGPAFASERAAYASVLTGARRVAVFLPPAPRSRAEHRIVEVFATDRSGSSGPRPAAR